MHFHPCPCYGFKGIFGSLNSFDFFLTLNLSGVNTCHFVHSDFLTLLSGLLQSHSRVTAEGQEAFFTVVLPVFHFPVLATERFTCKNRPPPSNILYMAVLDLALLICVTVSGFISLVVGNNLMTTVSNFLCKKWKKSDQ